MTDAIREVLVTLTEAGYDAYIVGGYVRDHLLGRPTGDCDIATSATPDEVEGLFSQVDSHAKQHGTIGVVCQGVVFEVTTFRRDGDYQDHRHPEAVTFSRSLSEDVVRRDFTVNALAMDQAGVILDLVGGQRDIEAKRLRAIGDPVIRLTEDALRILRALRFQSQLGFTLDTTLQAAMHECSPLVASLSKERVRDELMKLLAGPNLAQALTLYHSLSLPMLPKRLIARSDMSFVEQCAIAQQREGFDATAFPWTKEERGLLKAALGLAESPPSKFQLYSMAYPQAMIRIGTQLYHWNEKTLEQTWRSLVIHSRSDLQVNGHDVMALGVQGTTIETLLVAVEQAVIETTIPNEHLAIVAWMKEWIHEHQ